MGSYEIVLKNKLGQIKKTINMKRDKYANRDSRTVQKDNKFNKE